MSFYNSGAPCNRRTDWDCNVCSTESGHDQCPVSAWQQQVTFPRVTFSAFSPASVSFSKTWAPLDGAAVEKQRWTFRSWTSATTFTGRLRRPSIGNHPPQPYDDQPHHVHKPLRKQWSVSLRHQERKASGNLPLAYSAPRERRNCTRTESTTKVTKAQYVAARRRVRHRRGCSDSIKESSSDETLGQSRSTWSPAKVAITKENDDALQRLQEHPTNCNSRAHTRLVERRRAPPLFLKWEWLRGCSRSNGCFRLSG